MIILLIPSHDKNHRELQNQEMWAAEAMELFGELYGGATAFKALQGIYKDEDGNIHRDTPILIESYVKRVTLVGEEILNQLLAFSQRMGRETRQHTSMIWRDLPQLMARAVGQLAGHRQKQFDRIEAYKNLGFSDGEAHDFIVRALDARVIPVTTLPAVLRGGASPATLSSTRGRPGACSTASRRC
jgi:hypothetical protein